MKNQRHGQAAVITDAEYLKILNEIKTPKYKLLLMLGWYTGERWGCLVKLKVSDLYDSEGVREFVTFRAATRKASTNGSRKTRQVPIHKILREALKAYNPDGSEWMFPSRNGNKSILLKTADLILRAAVERAKLATRGISTHSTRRTFITKLSEAGYDLKTIAQITGHQDLKSLARYIEVDDNRIKGAIAAI